MLPTDINLSLAVPQLMWLRSLLAPVQYCLSTELLPLCRIYLNDDARRTGLESGLSWPIAETHDVLRSFLLGERRLEVQVRFQREGGRFGRVRRTPLRNDGWKWEEYGAMSVRET